MALHDIGAPVVALRTALHAMSKRPLEPNERELLERCDLAVTRLVELVRALMSPADPQGPSRSARRVDLAGIAREVCSSKSLGDSGPEIELHAREPILGFWNELRLWQIVDNLVSNAVIHAKGSPIVVSAGAEDGVASLSVEDFGPGIPKSLQTTIFERGTKRHGPGHGLGLWIARESSRELGGDLALVPKASAGARFVLRLPLRGEG